MDEIIYILDEGWTQDEYELIKIEDFSAFQYFNGVWNESIGLYGLIDDPGPTCYKISKEEAIEVMNKIDCMELIEKKYNKYIKNAQLFAAIKHQNQKYGIHPYFFHLEQVVHIAKSNNLSKPIIAACWLHDILEDTDTNYEQLKMEFDVKIADIVLAVTDEPGINRKERKRKTYSKIRTNVDALKVKLCDRIANITSCQEQKNIKLLSMYKKEHKEFYKALHFSSNDEQLIKLWQLLNSIIVH